ncbi:MAG: fibronectin type III domain-containing protein [Elusimicrobiota bacterium]|nr:fibronectin type III domain-containing protein [Elusimicrobiota bacterium]
MYKTTSDWHTGKEIWVTGLSTNTIFKFSADARNLDEVSSGYGAEESTSTLAVKPVASVFAVSVTSITVNWLANSNPKGTEYISEETMRTSQSSTTLNTYWLHSGLTPNTTYEYRVKAVNHDGISTAWVSLGSTITLAAVPPAPQVNEIYLTSASIRINTGSNPVYTQYSVKVSSAGWAGYVKGYNLGLSTYAVYDTTAGWHTDGEVWVTGLSTNTLFGFSANARNLSNRITGYGQAASSSTLSIIPGSIYFTGISSISITVNWTTNGNPDDTEYNIDCSTDSEFSPVEQSSSGIMGLNYKFSALNSGTTYYFRVQSRNRDGIGSGYVTDSEKTSIADGDDDVPPAKITNLTAIQGSAEGKIKLSWTSPGDDGTHGDLQKGSEFKIYYGTGTYNDNNISISTETAALSYQSYTITGLFPGTTWFFRIRTIDDQDNPAVLSDTATCAAPDLAPAPPTGLSLTPGVEKIYASWNENTEVDMDEYLIYYSTEPKVSETNYKEILSTTTTDNFIINGGLEAGVTYYVKLKAKDLAGHKSEFSIEKSTIPGVSGDITHFELTLYQTNTKPGEAFPIAGDEFTITAFSNEIKLSTFTGCVKLDAEQPSEFIESDYKNYGIYFEDENDKKVAPKFLKFWATGTYKIMAYWDKHHEIKGEILINVTPEDIDHFKLICPSPVSVGTQQFRVECLGKNNTMAYDYAGEVEFSYSGKTGGVNLPPDYTFTTSGTPAGWQKFSGDFNKAGDYTLEVADKSDGAIKGTADVTVTGNAGLDHFEFNIPEKIKAGEKFDLKLYARDEYDNLVSGFEKKVDLNISSGRLFTENEPRFSNGKLNSRAVVEWQKKNVTITASYQDISSSIDVEIECSGEAFEKAKEAFAWPVPANPDETPVNIRYYLKEKSEVEISIFTLTGRLVRNKKLSGNKGINYWKWFGKDNWDNSVLSDGYIVMIKKKYSDGTETEKFKLAILR